MKYDQHRNVVAQWAERKSAAEMEAWALNELRGLMADSRFAGVVWLLESQRESYVEAIGRQELAPHRGCLEHCAGSIHALNVLRDTLRAQSVAPAARPVPTQTE